MKAVTQVVAALSHVPGVVAAMVVGAADGLIVETSPMMGSSGAGDPRKHTAALAAYLYSKVTRASEAARLGNPLFMRLEAEHGQICVVGARDVVLVTIVTPNANLGRVRIDMMTAAKEES